jgi:integrase
MDIDLLLLGESSSRDADQLSDSALRSSKSHLRLLKLNNVALEKKTFLSGTNELINSLRDSKGNKLSTAYKQQILFTIKRLFPINDANYKTFKISTPRNYLPPEFKDDINKLIKFSLETLKNFQNDNFLLFEISQVILFIIATSLRIEEVRQLKFDHLEIIRNQQPVPIKSKRSTIARLIPNSLLLQNLMALIEKTKEEKRNAIPPILIYKSARLRAQSNYLFYFSTSLIRNKFKEFCILSNTKSKLTLNSLRKFTVTMIIDQGGIEAAAFLNNHSNANTTINNYNYQGEQNVTDTFAHLLENNIDFDISTYLPEPQQE